MAKVRYEEMLPHEIVEARTKCPIAYIGIGGVEWHGEHLCVGNDTVKAQALAERCAQKGGLAFPALFWGENRESHLMEANSDDQVKIAEKMGLDPANFAPGYMGRTVYQQDMAYVELLVHILRQIESLGFKVIVIIAGHYPLLNHARAAADLYQLNGKAKAWACTGYELVRDQLADAGDHAGKWETSLLMAMRPECVDLSRLPGDKSIPTIGTSVGSKDPRDSSQEYGRAGVEAVVNAITKRAKELLAEAG